MNAPQSKPNTRRKRGVVAVILRGGKLLVIRRSLTVTAPGKLCLPGGGIEKGESEEEALVREMDEELAIDVKPLGLCYRSVTPWGTNLAWWHADLDDSIDPTPNPDEVAEVFWMTRNDVRTAADLLPSLPPFVKDWDEGQIDVEAEWLD